MKDGKWLTNHLVISHLYLLMVHFTSKNYDSIAYIVLLVQLTTEKLVFVYANSRYVTYLVP